jgi:hypothetical protein
MLELINHIHLRLSWRDNELGEDNWALKRALEGV